MTATLVFGGLTLTGGAPYEILLSGADLGNPKPVVTSVRSLFLDGSVVTGRFSDNRTIAFQVLIRASTATATTSALDALAFQVDQATNTITWTPGTGLPQAFDTFRGELHESFDWEGRSSTQRLVTITMPALPFGRTPLTNTLTASTTAPVTIDDLETVATWNLNGHNPPYLVTASSSGPSPYHGTNDNYVYGFGQGVSGANYLIGSRTIASVNLGSNTVVGIWQYNQSATYLTWTSATLTLSSAGGSSTWVVSTVGQTANAWSATYWDLTQTPSSTTGSGYSASAVTGWTVRFDGTGNTAFSFSENFDYLAAYPPGYGTASSVDAGAYTMAPVVGSARTAVDLNVNRGGTNTLKDLLVYQAPIEQATSYAPLLVGATPYSTPAGASYAPGTYTVIASIKAASQSGANSIAASIQQTQGGSNVGTAWASGTQVSTAGDAYIVLGEVTLPLLGTSTANTGVGYTVTISGTNAANVLDLFLLDTRGSLVFVGPTPVTAAKYLFISSPAAATGVGGVYSGSTSTLSDATSLSASTRMSGGQMNFTPGSNTLVVCSTQANSDLAVTATYSPRWLTERTS